MGSTLLLKFAACVFAALPAGTELQYSGQVQRAEQSAGPDKTFSLAVLVTQPNELGYLIEERGAGSWGWPQRFGVTALDDTKTDPMRVLQLFDGNSYPVVVRRPVFSGLEHLVPEHEWREGSGNYVCLRTRMLGGKSVADVEATFDRGRRQTLVIERETGVILSLEERLFLGRGDAFRLTLKLDGRQTLAADEFAATTQLLQKLTDLQSRLGPPDGQYRSILSPAEVADTQTTLGALPRVPDNTWGRFVTSIQRDIAVQTRRLEGVEGLAQKYVGRPSGLPESLTRLDGTRLDRAELQGKTLVLHFWEYNGEKLAEPYGQVGYLDFLNSRRDRLGARVLGVAVDARFADPAQSRAAARSVSKFREFMNVGYPLVTDGGALLAQFGDPRAVGADLPLWIVIGHDGIITHYKVGAYNIQPDEGLRELDAAVVEGLKRQKAAERNQPQ